VEKDEDRVGQDKTHPVRLQGIRRFGYMSFAGNQPGAKQQNTNFDKFFHRSFTMAGCPHRQGFGLSLLTSVGDV
jgi:hypothetical protein